MPRSILVSEVRSAHHWGVAFRRRLMRHSASSTTFGAPPRRNEPQCPDSFAPWVSVADPVIAADQQAGLDNYCPKT